MPFDRPEPELMPYFDGLTWSGCSRSAALLYRVRLGKDKPWIAVQNISFRNTDAPTMEEQRYCVFMPVILGARGIFFWMYSEARWHAKDPEYFGRVMNSARELSEIAPVIMSQEPLPEWMLRIETSGEVCVLKCSMGGRAYVLAGPASPDGSGWLHVTVPRGIQLSQPFAKSKPHRKSGGTIEIPIRPKRVVVLQFRERSR